MRTINKVIGINDVFSDTVAGQGRAGQSRAEQSRAFTIEISRTSMSKDRRRSL